MTKREEYLARLAREYLDNMIERMRFHGETEIMEFLREQADGDFEEVVLAELPE